VSTELAIPSARGAIAARFDPPAPGRRAAALLVGGGDGGFDGPAEALYPDLVDDLAALGCGALRLDFRIHRFPNDPAEGVFDVLAGIEYLASEGIDRVALVGHSFGGAVVIEAGVRSQHVVAVATLATQTAGAQHVAELAPTPLLLVHGLADIRLSPESSRLLYRYAGEPKRLELLEGATHSLRQRRADVRRLLVAWFAEHLAGADEG